MFARRYGLVIALLLIPVEAHAHLHKAAAYFGPSFDRGSRLDGFTIGGEFMLPKEAKPGGQCNALFVEKCTSQLSFFLYTSGNWGKHNGGDRTQLGLSGGFRFTYTIPYVSKAFEVYGHVIGAFVHTQDSKLTTFDHAGGVGGGAGITIDLSHPLHLKEEVVARVQYDYLKLWGGEVRRYKLVSVGLEYRFGSYAKPKATVSTAQGSSQARRSDP